MHLKTKDLKIGDLLGITSSTLCLVHCLAVPILLGVSGLNHNHGIDYWLFDISLILLSFIGLKMVCSTSSKRIKLALFGFFGLLVSSQLFGYFSVHSLEWACIGYLGSLGLISTHFIHLKSCCIKPRELKN